MTKTKSVETDFASISWTGCKQISPASHFGRQVYKLDDNGSGKPIYFDVARMVEFASKKLQAEPLQADFCIAEEMVNAEKVDLGHVLRLADEGRFKPIIVCVGAAKNGKTLIVDGNHRYVASAYIHKRLGGNMLVPAYFFEKDQWQRFILPEADVSRMGLYDPTKSRNTSPN